MEHESAGAGDLSSGFCVNGVAENRGSNVAHVHADLMGASRVEVAKNEARFIRVLVDHRVVRNGCFSAARIADCHFHSVYRVSPDVGENAVFGIVWRALNDGEVAFFGCSVGELVDERLMSHVVFGGDNTPRSVFI